MKALLLLLLPITSWAHGVHGEFVQTMPNVWTNLTHLVAHPEYILVLFFVGLLAGRLYRHFDM
jgi:hypothetical protein